MSDKGCFKLAKTKTPKEQASLIFLSLRRKGCNKKKAIRFACRNNCKTDPTSHDFGPIGFKTLQLNRKEKFLLFKEKGWIKGNMSYDLGTKYGSNIKRDGENPALEEAGKITTQIFQKKKQAYVEKLQVINDFFNKESDYALKGKKGIELFQKVDLF